MGSYIRSLRLENGMTQAQLAHKLGVTDKAVSKWERDLSYPDIAIFPKLADYLGVSVNDLLNECIEEGQPSRLLRILGMSHDIRTPLHIILGCVNMAENHSDDKEALLHYLESIRISGEYLLRSFDQMMQVAQDVEAGAEAGGAAPGEQAEGAGKGRGEEPANIRELGEYLNRRAKARDLALKGYDFTGRRILVAEDIRMNREIVAEILRQTGAETAFARDGLECVEMVEKEPAGHYDLILMDIMMPVMDGMEATKRIRALPDQKKASIPIVAVSANVYDKDRSMAFDSGMDDFTEKPIFIDKLLETLERHLK